MYIFDSQTHLLLPCVLIISGNMFPEKPTREKKIIVVKNVSLPRYEFQMGYFPAL